MKLELEFVAPSADSVHHLPDGSTRIVAARLTKPERWAGQVRDVTHHPDGSITIGPDRRRGDTLPDEPWDPHEVDMEHPCIVCGSSLAHNHPSDLFDAALAKLRELPAE